MLSQVLGWGRTGRYRKRSGTWPRTSAIDDHARSVAPVALHGFDKARVRLEGAVAKLLAAARAKTVRRLQLLQGLEAAFRFLVHAFLDSEPNGNHLERIRKETRGK